MPPMEGLGAAASILQVADIGFEVGIALFKYARKVAYAEKQLKELGDQVEANATCLKTVGTLLDDPETRALHTAKLYDDTRAVSRGCKEVFYELDKTISKLDDGGSKLSVGARLQWPLYSRKFADLLKVLKNYNDVLHLMLAVLQILEGRRVATSNEVQALGKSLRRLSISNASLSKSNKNLVDMLSTHQQAPKKTDIDHASQIFLKNQRCIDGPDGDPAISTRVMHDFPKTSPVKNQKPRSIDFTHDHLQRCMDSVQELANTIACAMSAWQGQEKNGSSDVHGSHAKLVADISELPKDLECETCRGRVSWSHFDLVKAASECLGTCTCANRTSSSHWRCRNYDPADTYEDSDLRWRETKPRRGRVTYPERPRRPSMLEKLRSGFSNPAPPRNMPTVVQGDFARASSPLRRSQSDYYIRPDLSKEPKATQQFQHKTLHSVNGGGAKLVADVDLSSGGERYHKRRQSSDRLGYRSTGYDCGRKPYHASGKKQKTLDDDDAFSYTDPASMYKDTEPRWRETRQRRGSVDGGGANKEHPISMIDPYYIAPREISTDRNRASPTYQDQSTESYGSDYEDYEECAGPRHRERRISATRHMDRSISRRGFGLRSDSKDRYSTYSSDESFERNREAARDSGFADGHRNAPSESHQYIPYPQKSKRKECGRSYDDHDRDSDRDRPRRGDSDREEYRERHHHRRNSSRDDDKKDGDNGISGAAKIAAGGLGAAATLYGLNREKSKKEDREREEREEREPQYEHARQRESDRARDRDEEPEMSKKRMERRLSKRTGLRLRKRTYRQSPKSDTEATNTDVANGGSGDTSIERLKRRVQSPAGEVIDNNTKNKHEDHARVVDILPEEPLIERVPRLSSQSFPRSPGYTEIEEERPALSLPASPSRTALAAEHPPLKRSHSQMVAGTGNISSPLAPKLDDDDDDDDEVEDLSPTHSQLDRDEAMEGSSALQALLNRWLGDNADAVLPGTA